jgi:hypothetical protein
VTENAPAINHGAKLRATFEPASEQPESLLVLFPASGVALPNVPPVAGGGTGFARARLAANSEAARNERAPVFFIGILHSEIGTRPARIQKNTRSKAIISSRPPRMVF